MQVLHYLKVEKLVIPSVSERIGAWVANYSFHKVKSPLPEEMKLHNTLMFHDSTRLQKDLISSSLARTCRANSRGFPLPTNPPPSYHKYKKIMANLDLIKRNICLRIHITDPDLFGTEPDSCCCSQRDTKFPDEIWKGKTL